MNAKSRMRIKALPWQSSQSLRAAYQDGSLSVRQCVEAVLARRCAVQRAEIWISAPSDDALLAQADALDARLASEGPALLETLPLFGQPFAVKDNMDLAGLPTTAGCPAYAYQPRASTPVIQKLLDAGAVCIGKTNLDQFATGLVGTRSPHGAVRNAYDTRYISGGSSSGSAVAVALALCTFALGSDTAGSGRVPAGLNGIVGLKPSRGLVSNRGVVPACRTLDCVSILAGSVADAWQVLRVAEGYDEADAHSQIRLQAPPPTGRLRIAIPSQLEFFGDAHAEAAWHNSLAALESLPACDWRRIDIAPLIGAAKLLYEGPWVAERRAALGSFFAAHRDAMDPTVATIIAGAERHSAIDAFNAQYRLAEYRREADALFADIDALLVPTTPTHPTLEAVAADPIARNSQLGYYTNFVNLLDLAALAIPGVPRSDGLPAGLTLIAPGGCDHRLAVIGAQCEARIDGAADSEAVQIAAEPLRFAEPTLILAVVGAHLSGQPLNGQLLSCGARLLGAARTAPVYRLYLLRGTVPPKPGLVRVSEGGCALDIELWEMPSRHVGHFIGMVPPPMAIGTVQLECGDTVKGFLCEPQALDGATDISHHGGWRGYLASQAA